MHFKNTAVIILALVLSLSLFSCKSPTGPTSDNTPPGRRDYVWSVDTLQTTNVLHSISGTSPNDIWVVGGGGVDYKEIWHYDGNKWNYNDTHFTTPNCVFSISKDNVWIGGNDGNIFHYNGYTWNKNFTFQIDNSNSIDINDIWGVSAADIYAVGSVFIGNNPRASSFILHYNGVKWSEKYLSEPGLFFYRMRGENNIEYLSGEKLPNTTKSEAALDTIIFYKDKNNELEKIYVGAINKIVYGSMNLIGDHVYFLIGKDLNRYVDGRFEKITTFNLPNFGYQIYGRNEKDIFIRMQDGLVHYNGEDTKYLLKHELYKISISSNALIFDDDVYFVAPDYGDGTNIIYHGKLKD